MTFTVESRARSEHGFGIPILLFTFLLIILFLGIGLYKGWFKENASGESTIRAGGSEDKDNNDEEDEDGDDKILTGWSGFFIVVVLAVCVPIALMLLAYIFLTIAAMATGESVYSIQRVPGTNNLVRLFGPNSPNNQNGEEQPDAEPGTSEDPAIERGRRQVVENSDIFNEEDEEDEEDGVEMAEV